MSPRPAALVTGGAVRLGRAMALCLAGAGYDVALHYNTSEAAAQSAAAEIRSHGARCELFACDLAQTHGLAGLMQRVHAAFPQLAVLVNSASAYTAATIAETTPGILQQMWDVNFTAPFFLTQAFAGLVGQGSIVNVLDNKIAFNQFHYAAYLGSKKALAELTRMAALEFAPRIRVNGIAPGVILPAPSRDDRYLQWRHQGIPMSGIGHPDHIGSTLLFILNNAFVTGQVIFTDGGEGMNVVGRNASSFDPVNS